MQESILLFIVKQVAEFTQIAYAQEDCASCIRNLSESACSAQYHRICSYADRYVPHRLDDRAVFPYHILSSESLTVSIGYYEV